MQKLRNSQISEEAADWAVRLDAGKLSSEERAALAGWLLESPAHVDELLLSASLFCAVSDIGKDYPLTLEDVLRDRADEVIHLVRAGQGPSLQAESGLKAWTPRRYMTRMAAGFAAVAALFFAVVFFSAGQGAHKVLYETARGEQRSVVLKDGSVLYLNTLSRVAVNYSKRYRLLELQKGEALFNVKHDPTRPFRVMVGDKAVEALGTIFNIDYSEGKTDVSVLRGKVAVGRQTAFAQPGGVGSVQSENLSFPREGQEALHSATPIKDDQKLIIAVHQQATFEGDGRYDVQVNVSPEVVTSWRLRRLIFNDRLLIDIVREFNRYNSLQIEVRGSALSSLRLSGVFDADDPLSLVQYLELQANIAVDRSTPNRLVIIPKAEAASKADLGPVPAQTGKAPPPFPSQAINVGTGSQGQQASVG